MNLAELQKRQAAIKAELRKLHADAGDAELSAEAKTSWDSLNEELTRNAASIEAIETRRKAVADLVDSAPEETIEARTETGDDRGPQSPEFMRKVTPFDGSDIVSMRNKDAVERARKVVNMPEHNDHLDERQKVALERLLRTRDRNTRGDLIAKRLLITENPHYRSAFMKIATSTTPILTQDEQRAMQAWNELRAMNIGTDGDGGFGVPVLIDPTIILTAQGHPNDFFAISNVKVITTDVWKGVSSAGVTWSYDAEASAVSDDSPTLAQPTVVTHMARGFIPFSIEVGMDYPGFAEEMAVLLASGYSELNVDKFTRGSGTGEPFGIVTVLDANTNVEVVVTTDGAFGAVDVYNLWKSLPIRYRQKAVNWMSHTDVMNAVRQFGDDEGANFSVNITQETLPRLFGAPYRENDYMGEFTGTTGASNLLIVGDWSNFVIAQRAGMSVELVPHLFDVTDNRPTGQRGWFAWARNGSDSVNDLGFRMLQNQ